MSVKTGIINDIRMLDHKSKRKHPQNPARVKAIMKKLAEQKYLNHPNIQFIQQYQRFATDQELLLTYPKKYVEYVKQLWQKASHRTDITILDTYFNQKSNDIARLSVGGVLEGVDHVMNGRWKNGFSIIRPPGHHSGSRNTLNGFCIFNNVAIGARYLQTQYNLKKIAILDWDVHHGDGTQAIFDEDESILFISVHRHDRGHFYPSGNGGNYPNCGKGLAEGTKLNIPLNTTNKKHKSYSFQLHGDNQFIYIYNRIIDPVIRQFNPDFILVSSGFDAARYDYLGNLTVTPNGYFYMTKKLMEIGKPLLAVLQGGYNYNSTAEASLAVVKGLLNQQELPEPIEQFTYENMGDYCHLVKQFHSEFDQIIDHHSKWWKCLLSEELIKYTDKIKMNKEKVYGIVGSDHQTSSSSQQEDNANKLKKSGKQQNKRVIRPMAKNQAQKLEQQKKQVNQAANNQLQNQKSSLDQGTTQFYFAAGHMQRFKNFSLHSDRVHKWAYPEQLLFYQSSYPERVFAPKYYGQDGQYIVIENMLHEQKDHVVMDIKLSRLSKNIHNSEEKREKERKKQQTSTTQKYAFRIGGFTTPTYKEGGLLISDVDLTKKLLSKVVSKHNKQLFCIFLREMAAQLKQVKRHYFGTSIVLVKGQQKSTIKWVDFHYWFDNCETYDKDLVEGVQNLQAFIKDVPTDGSL